MQKNIKNIIKAVKLYEIYNREDNRGNSWDGDAVAEARKNYMNHAIAIDLDTTLLSKLSHMEHCDFRTNYPYGFQTQEQANNYAEGLEKRYPQLLEWYATYMDCEDQAIMARKFRNLLKEVTENVAA